MQSADEPATPGPDASRQVAPDSIGATLAAARRAAGLTIDDVSDRTRIRASLIEQIEREDFSGCGGTVYARGHLRSIATTLELDPAPLLAAYDAGHERVPSPVVVASSEFDPLNGGGARRGMGGFRWAPAMIASLVVVCVLALVALVLPGGGGDEDDATARPSIVPSTAAATAPAAPTAAATPPQPPGVNVRVEAHDAQSWLEVRDEGGKPLLAQLLQQGDSREVSSEGALEIKMGNAGAVDLTCNGRDLGKAGGPGEVVTIRLALAESGGGCAVGGGDGRATGLAAAGRPAVSGATGAAAQPGGTR
ncbi:dihydrolipoyllysine acetyltransferase [Frankia sp. R43]|uniref:helix-turn-helix domain-containing protein n=1 Tax=Frankia sp. R43 TaxID=269536 RepID=UPI0006C9F2D7|nr:helix-turn-helix domain-containing protein [Frankia sp. R43]KPM57179.1 dihydrolipoyllysine acetyltransferase [Frankia sp. R43]